MTSGWVNFDFVAHFKLASRALIFQSKRSVERATWSNCLAFTYMCLECEYSWLSEQKVKSLHKLKLSDIPLTNLTKLQVMDRVFPVDLRPKRLINGEKKTRSVTYSTDLENEVTNVHIYYISELNPLIC